jgi:hypothetical protein
MANRYRTAIHEMGHAIMLRHYGYAVDAIGITDDGGECRSAQFDAALENGGARVCKQAIAVSFAGLVAVEEIFGTDDPGYSLSCTTDMGTLNHALEELGGSIEDCNVIREEARQIVRAHRYEIEREARLLVNNQADWLCGAQRKLG